MARPTVGLIGGSGLQSPSVVEDPTPKSIATPFGNPSEAPLIGHHGRMPVLFIPRHGAGHRIPPHRINHRANLWALKELGATHILSTSSTGSLKRSIRPGSFVVPHDFVALWSIPTFHDDEVVHATPGLDPDLRKELASAAKSVRASVHSRGIYVQTGGPRLETPAEIAHLAQLGDVVGMTMGSEATLASELGIPYATICSVDNFANGIASRPVTFDSIRKTQRRTQAVLVKIVARALEDLG
jgi:5'-deoxy-5'-methylthioadenosine phosphorylase